MKKINSIEYGGKILGVAMIFALVIPGAMRLVLLVYETAVLAICAKISLGIGIVIALSFCALLAIEFHQDKEQNLYYETQKKVKLSLGNGIYECQSCGNKTVKAKDKSCCICGILFEDMGEQNEKSK